MEIKGGNYLHRKPLLDYYKNKIQKVFPYIDVLNITYKKGRPYAQIFNKHCGHSCLLRVDHITDARRECSDPACIHQNLSLASKGKPKSLLHRKHIKEAQNRPDIKEKMSKSVKNAFTRPDVRQKHSEGIYNAREKHAKGIAAWQRRKASADEMYVKQYLESHNIEFIYQYPYVDSQFEFIIDFYIPKRNMFIQVNTDPYHCLDESSKSIKYKERALYTINKDKQLLSLFNSSDIGRLFQITDLSQLEDIIRYYGGDDNG